MRLTGNSSDQSMQIRKKESNGHTISDSKPPLPSKIDSATLLTRKKHAYNF
jgi:hypothetical protein